VSLSTSTAAELTAEQVQSILIQPLEQASTFLAAGPRIFDSASQVRIPKLSSGTSPSWYGENEQIIDDDAEFDEIVLLPSTMKSVKVLTRFSNELARQSVIALDAALRDRLVRDVADKIDTQFWGETGDGVTTPKGIFAWDDTQALPVDFDALTLDDLHDAYGLALAANVDTTALRWAMRPDTFVSLRKLQDGNERYQLQPDPTADGVYRLLGAPVTITNRIPEDYAVLADFSQIAVARDQAPSVKILDQTFGDYDQQAIRVTARYDAAALNPEAVIVLTADVS
jgi:HK97 family phage major capsid protein